MDHRLPAEKISSYYTLMDWSYDAYVGSSFPFTTVFYERYWISILTSCVLLSFSFFFLRNKLIEVERPAESKNKKLSWILSLFAASLSFLISCPLLASFFLSLLTKSRVIPAEHTPGFFAQFPDLWTQKFQYELRRYDSAFAEIFLSASFLADFCCIFMCIFFLMDLLLGFMYYPKQLAFLSGWFHHIVYSVFLINALYWQCSSGIALCFVEELPTVILATGSIYPDLRADLGFGVSFFFLRILFHGIYTLLGLIHIRAYTYSWVFGVATLILHSWWFFSWMLKLRGYRNLSHTLSMKWGKLKMKQEQDYVK